MHGRERKPVAAVTDAQTQEALKNYATSEEVRTELLSPKGCVSFSFSCPNIIFLESLLLEFVGRSKW